DHFQYVWGMEHYRRTAHTRFDIKLHLVWITKYRKKFLRGDVGVRLRQIVRTICAELEVEILKGHVRSDHVHLFVSCPPHVSASCPDAAGQGEEFAGPDAGVRPPEEALLGSAPLGWGVLRGQLGR